MAQSIREYHIPGDFEHSEDDDAFDTAFEKLLEDLRRESDPDVTNSNPSRGTPHHQRPDVLRRVLARPCRACETLLINTHSEYTMASIIRHQGKRGVTYCARIRKDGSYHSRSFGDLRSAQQWADLVESAAAALGPDAPGAAARQTLADAIKRY